MIIIPNPFKGPAKFFTFLKGVFILLLKRRGAYGVTKFPQIHAKEGEYSLWSRKIVI